jgi:hypothetical protein
LHPVTLRLDGKEYSYAKGMRVMPYEHARALRLLRRIRGEVQEPTPEPLTADPAFVALVSVFDGKIAEVLTNAGYANLADLAAASHDELRALDGIGPARFEEIQAALGRRSAQEEGE